MTIYTCEREFETMLTAIYEAWNSGIGHNNIRMEIEPVGQYSFLDNYIHVDYDECKYSSVADAINQKISPLFFREMLKTSLYYSEDVFDNIYRMLLLGFKFGSSALEMIQYGPVSRNFDIRRAYQREVYRFQEIVRFHEIRKSLLVSHIEPKSRIVAQLGPIFMDRMPSEHWMVVDDVHSEAVVHPSNEMFYVRRLNQNELEALKNTEGVNDEYTDLWKAFFDSVAIKERTNPRYQANSFPIWSRKHAVEFL